MMKKNSVSEESLIKPKTLEEVRAMIRSHKRNDFIFSSIGLLTITFALLTLLILFVDLVMKVTNIIRDEPTHADKIPAFAARLEGKSVKN